MGIRMRGEPLRCPYHLYTKKNKSVSCFTCLQTYYTRRMPMKNQLSIQEKLWDLRRDHDYKLEEVAAAVNVSSKE